VQAGRSNRPVVLLHNAVFHEEPGMYLANARKRAHAIALAYAGRCVLVECADAGSTSCECLAISRYVIGLAMKTNVQFQSAAATSAIESESEVATQGRKGTLGGWHHLQYDMVTAWNTAAQRRRVMRLPETYKGQ
jgi:hypothetical protein